MQLDQTRSLETNRLDVGISRYLVTSRIGRWPVQDDKWVCRERSRELNVCKRSPRPQRGAVPLDRKALALHDERSVRRTVSSSEPL